MSNIPPVISDILSNSGNSFHYKVVRYFRDNGWSVLVSPYYSDNITNKPREIDIIAEKKFEYHTFPNTYVGEICIRLFIECKKISLNTLFWFDGLNEEKTIGRIAEDLEITSTHDSDFHTKHHYYLQKQVAKLFESENKREPDNEIIYKAINQSLNSLIYFRNTDSILPENEQSNIIFTLNYPVIVCDGYQKCFKVDTDKTEIEQITDVFQAEINYAFIDVDNNKKNEFFIVDIVSFEKLKQYLDALNEHDVTALRTKMEWYGHFAK
ncbi:MAG: hypothetical protein V1907_04425 [Candidatus Kerfeldbacteria bacterium]